jgi:hypothetical protein
MSKMDALRAMREARYAEAVDRAAQAKKTPTTTPKTSQRTRPPVAPPEAAAPEPAPDGRCGHRSMNGRTCTREAGHAAKSHRYS